MLFIDTMMFKQVIAAGNIEHEQQIQHIITKSKVPIPWNHGLTVRPAWAVSMHAE